MSSINHKIESNVYNELTRITISPLQQLRRTLLTCLLWENSYYESGQEIATRITELTAVISAEEIKNLAIETVNQNKLRHAPLMLAVGAYNNSKQNGFTGQIARETIESILTRPDAISEIISIYWRNGKLPLPNSMKKAIANTFSKFNEYQLAKWDKNNTKISLKDVMFLTHPKPQNKDQEVLFKKLANSELEIPDTWETNLSAGKDKKETFTRLMNEKKLGALAFLRNLRNMIAAKVDNDLIKTYLKDLDVSKILPFRFITASKYAGFLYKELNDKFLDCINSVYQEKLEGKTIILVDESGSMRSPVSEKSDIYNIDCAATVAAMCYEICNNVDIYGFNVSVRKLEIKNSGLDITKKFNANGGTKLGLAINEINREDHDRLIVITDEQSRDKIPLPNAKFAYMINVASNKNGVGYGNNWIHIDGWSESILTFIYEYEKFIRTCDII